VAFLHWSKILCSSGLSRYVLLSSINVIKN